MRTIKFAKFLLYYVRRRLKKDGAVRTKRTDIYLFVGQREISLRRPAKGGSDASRQFLSCGGSGPLPFRLQRQSARAEMAMPPPPVGSLRHPPATQAQATVSSRGSQKAL